MRSFKLPAIGLAVIAALLAAGLAWQVTRDGGGSDDAQTERLITDQVEIRDLIDSININGTLERSEITTVNAVAAGQVSRVDLDDGATVEVGDTILTIDGRASVAVPGELPFFRSLDVGAAGADVLQLEQILEVAGYSPGEVDTVYTEQTRLALASWQAFYGYPGASAEADETITVSLSPAAGYTVGPQGSAAVTIGPPEPLGFQTPPVAQITTFPISVSEGATLNVAVSIDAVQATDTTLHLTYSGTASLGADYLNPPATVVIPTGATTASFPLEVESDSLIEPDESIVVSLVANAAYTLGAQTATTVTIPATGGNPVLTVRANSGTVAEGAPMTFTIVASADPAGAVNVNFAVQGTAKNGIDFFAPIGPIELADDATEVVVTMSAASDLLVEPDETVILVVLPGVGYQVGNPSSATTTIKSTNVPEFGLAGQATINEGQQGTIRVTSTQAPAQDTGLTLQYSGDALPDDDYVTPSANIIFPKGALTVDIPILSLVDNIFEKNEKVTVTLVASQTSGYTVGPVSTQTITILGDSSAGNTPILKIASNLAVTTEGQPASFTVESDREVGSELDIVLGFSGPAAAGFDVVAPSETISIQPGQKSVTFQVETRQDDAVEFDELLIVSLGSSADYRVSTLSSASVVVKNDDLPELQVRGGGAVGEGSATGFTVFADQPVAQDTSVTYQAVGTATPGVDFKPVTGTVLMRAGASTASISIATLSDDVVFRPTDMIVADWPSRVGTVLVEPGQSVQPGLPLFNITEPEFTITIDVNPSDRGDLVVGQEVNVEIDAGGQDTTGVIAELDEAATTDTQTGSESYKGRVEITDQLPAVDGASVRIEVILEKREGAVTVPIAAVFQNDEGNESVRVINLETGSIVPTVITTGLQEDAFIEILDGLVGNEVVLVAVER